MPTRYRKIEQGEILLASDKFCARNLEHVTDAYLDSAEGSLYFDVPIPAWAIPTSPTGIWAYWRRLDTPNVTITPQKHLLKKKWKHDNKIPKTPGR